MIAVEKSGKERRDDLQQSGLDSNPGRCEKDLAMVTRTLPSDSLKIPFDVLHKTFICSAFRLKLKHIDTKLDKGHLTLMHNMTSLV